MNNHRTKSAKPIRKRRAPPKVTEVFGDCTITVRGDKVWMSGPLAEELAAAARKAGVTFQEAFNYCIRTGLPKVVAEFHEAAKAKTTGENLEARFDAGEDVSDYFDYSAARRINRKKSKAAKLKQPKVQRSKSESEML